MGIPPPEICFERADEAWRYGPANFHHSVEISGVPEALSLLFERNRTHRAG